MCLSAVVCLFNNAPLTSVEIQSSEGLEGSVVLSEDVSVLSQC